MYAFESPAIGVPYIIQYINNNHSNNDCKKPYSCTHKRTQFHTYRTEIRLNDKPFISLCCSCCFQNVFIFYNVPKDGFCFFDNAIDSLYTDMETILIRLTAIHSCVHVVDYSFNGQHSCNRKVLTYLKMLLLQLYNIGCILDELRSQTHIGLFIIF